MVSAHPTLELDVCVERVILDFVPCTQADKHCSLLVNAHCRWRDVCVCVILDDFRADAFKKSNRTICSPKINSKVDGCSAHALVSVEPGVAMTTSPICMICCCQ